MSESNDNEFYDDELDAALLEKLKNIKKQVRRREALNTAEAAGSCIGAVIKLAVYASIIGLAIHFLF